MIGRIGRMCLGRGAATRRGLLLVFLIALFPFAAAAETQKIWKLGFLSPADGQGPNHAAFLAQLKKSGYVEGDNLQIEWVFTHQQFDLLAEGARSLVEKNVDVIASQTQAAAMAAKAATSKIPIVFMGVRDPVVAGLVTSLNRPGFNATGVTLTTSVELVTKQVELMRELVPACTKLGVLWNTKNVIQADVLSTIKSTMRPLGIEVFSYGVGNKTDIAPAFDAMAGDHVQGLMTLVDPLLFEDRALIGRLAIEKRIATSFEVREYVDAGGLFSYGISYSEHYANGASYVAKILGGARPDEIPVLLPSRFEIVLNTKTAKALQIDIPPSVIVRATDFID